MSCGVLVKSGASSQADGLKFALDALARESKPTSALQQALALLTVTSLSLPAGPTAEVEAPLAQRVRHLCQRSSEVTSLASRSLIRGRELLRAADLALQADLCLICCWSLCFDADLLQAGGGGSSRG
jgi:hypothetical protein